MRRRFHHLCPSRCRSRTCLRDWLRCGFGSSMFSSTLKAFCRSTGKRLRAPWSSPQRSCRKRSRPLCRSSTAKVPRSTPAFKYSRVLFVSCCISSFCMFRSILQHPDGRFGSERNRQASQKRRGSKAEGDEHHFQTGLLPNQRHAFQKYPGVGKGVTQEFTSSSYLRLCV